MFRILTAFVLISIIYLFASALSKYDSTLYILFLDYRIEVNFFVIIIAFILLVSLTAMGLRTVTFILKIPYLIWAKLAGYRKINNIKILLDSYVYLNMSRLDLAQKTILKLEESSLDTSFVQYVSLLKALTNNDYDRNEYLTSTLLNKKEHYDYAVKAIASRMFVQGYHEQSLKFVEQANINFDYDQELLYLVICSCAELNIWDSFASYIEKYLAINKELTDARKLNISNLYLKSAKYYLAQGNESMAFEFLEKALKYNPISVEAIEIFCSLNNSQGMNYRNLPILENAFVLKPSFELFELYHQSTSMNSIDIYEKFYNLLEDARGYKDVFLSIAAYLKLFDKIDELLSCAI